MARDFDGTNDKISYGNISAVSTPTTLSFSCWIWNDVVTADMQITSNETSGNPGHRLYMDDVGSVSGRTDMYNIVVRETVGAGGTSVRIEGATGSATTGSWQHLFFSAEAGSATGLQLWVNGAEDANSPVSIAALADLGNQATDSLVIGEEAAGTADFNGKLAEIAYWNRILTDSEIVSLSKGISPLFLSNGLVFYDPLLRYTNDIRGGVVGTATGTTVFDHPRIIYPSASQMRRFTTATASTTSIKDLIGGFIPFAR